MNKGLRKKTYLEKNSLFLRFWKQKRKKFLRLTYTYKHLKTSGTFYLNKNFKKDKDEEAEKVEYLEAKMKMIHERKKTIRTWKVSENGEILMLIYAKSKRKPYSYST